jgi:hypothetical protein
MSYFHVSEILIEHLFKDSYSIFMRILNFFFKIRWIENNDILRVFIGFLSRNFLPKLFLRLWFLIYFDSFLSRLNFEFDMFIFNIFKLIDLFFINRVFINANNIFFFNRFTTKLFKRNSLMSSSTSWFWWNRGCCKFWCRSAKNLNSSWRRDESPKLRTFLVFNVQNIFQRAYRVIFIVWSITSGSLWFPQYHSPKIVSFPLLPSYCSRNQLSSQFIPRWRSLRNILPKSIHQVQVSSWVQPFLEDYGKNLGGKSVEITTTRILLRMLGFWGNKTFIVLTF